MELEKTNQNEILKETNQNAILKETTRRIAMTLVIATLPFWVYLFYLYAGGYKTEAKSSLIFYSVVTGVLLVVFAFNYFYYWSILGNGEKTFEDWIDFENLLSKTKLIKEEVLADSIKKMYTLANLIFAADLASCTKNYFHNITEFKAIVFIVITITIMTVFSHIQRFKTERRMSSLMEQKLIENSKNKE